MGPIRYTRLPGRAQPYFGIVSAVEYALFLAQIRIFERYRLYEADDHVLLVKQHFFSEKTHRFYFTDIQAITVRRTSNHLLCSAVLSIASAVLLLFTFPPLGELAGLPPNNPLPWLAILLLAALAANILLGPTCQAELHTAVHRQPLPNCARWRTAAKLVQRLAPRIREAQAGRSAPEAAPTEGGQEALGPRLIADQHSELVSAPRFTPAETADSVRKSAVYFYLLLVCAVSAAIDIFVYNEIKNTLDALLYSGSLVWGAVGMGYLRRSQAPRVLKALHGTGIAFTVVFFYTSQFAVTFALFPQIVAGDFTPLAGGETSLLVLSIIGSILFGLLSLIGLYQVWQFRLGAGRLA